MAFILTSLIPFISPLIAAFDGEEGRALLVLVWAIRKPEATKVVLEASSPSMILRQCYLLSLYLTGKVMAVFLLLHLLLQMLLLLSGDVETNPGPITGEQVVLAETRSSIT